MSPGAPEPRNYAQETRDTLQAQIDLAPDRYAAEATYGPKYTALNVANLTSALRGDNGQGGLLDLYQQDVYPVLADIENRSRSARIAGELDAIKQFAPDVTRTLREASGNAPLLEKLNAQAMEGLDAGAGLDASTANEVSQGVRAAQASRGFGFGVPDAVVEGYARGDRGNQLRRERQQFAQGVVAQNQATGGDPVMAILGRPSQTMSAGQGVVAQGAGASAGSLFNPESAYASDIFNTNYNGQAATNIAGANNANALLGAGLGAFGQLGGSAMSSDSKSL
jgi:hypothetical protein